MQLLIIFRTIAGWIRKIAGTGAERLSARGHGVKSVKASRISGEIDHAAFDSCRIAVPVHQQRQPYDVANFVRADLGKLNGLNARFVLLSLATAFPDGYAEPKEHTDRFMARSGWLPQLTHTAAGALRFKEHDFLPERIIRHVVLKDHLINFVGHDHEFTDWSALTSYVDEFAERIKALEPVP